MAVDTEYNTCRSQASVKRESIVNETENGGYNGNNNQEADSNVKENIKNIEKNTVKSKEKRPMIVLKTPPVPTVQPTHSPHNEFSVEIKSSVSTLRTNHTPPRNLSRSFFGSIDENEQEEHSFIEDDGFVTIDHWTVHANELPIQLQVLIPRESDWLGTISDPCLEVRTCIFF